MTEWLADRSWRALGVALSRPRRVLAIGLAVAVVGLALDTQSEVVSDVRELVPQDLQALRDVNVLQDETGVSGEIDVTVRADDITDPKVIAWMTSFQNRVLRAHGYRPGKRCTQKRNAPELCPALSLPDLFSTATQVQVGTLLDAVPTYFSQGVVTADRKTANLAFGIRLMPLDRQKQVVDDIKAALKPPDGVSASVVGLPVLAAEANGALSSPLAPRAHAARRARRRVPRAVRRAALGARGGRAADPDRARHRLVRARAVRPRPAAGPARGGPQPDVRDARRARDRDLDGVQRPAVVALPPGARRAAPARRGRSSWPTRPPGAAVLASGATAIAGFAALIFSDIRMLRDFGIVTVVDLTVSLLGVMIVLPAALMWAEEHGPFRVRDPLAAAAAPRAQADTT